MKSAGVATWIVVCCCVQMLLCSRIRLENNGYKDVLVAIHPSVPEDPQLITNLEILFTNASKFLYESTKGKVYFKEITIAVPTTWSWNAYYRHYSGNHFATADVQVDLPNPLYGDAPYTQQLGDCGEPGQYIHLTPRFVKEVDKVTEMFGMPERQLVHEWAHLRYGIFDEYGIPGDRLYPSFYIENNKVHPTSCTGGIPGWIRSTNGRKCCLLRNGQVNSDCIFVPDMTSTISRASIMSTPFFPSVDRFCDDSSSAATKHNTRAPTRQNAMCNHQSTWSVISKHEDFLNTRRVVPRSLVPTFQVIQPARNDKGTYVLLLDVSHSMEGTPLTLLRQAATRFIEDRLPDGARLGIVVFGGTATELQPLTTVSSSKRKILSGSLPTRTISATGIGNGLNEAIRVLKQGQSFVAGTTIILATDGEENQEPFITEVTPKIVEEKIIVNTLALGTKASEKLEKLTKATGGKAYFFSDLKGIRSSSGLDSAFLESTTIQSDIELQPQRLIDKVFTLENSAVQKTIIIDNDLGKDTVFTVTSPSIGKVDLTLRSPTGVIYNSQSREYNRDVNRRERIEILLPRAESGKWTISLSRQGGVSISVTVSVISKPFGSKTHPITVKAWLSDTEVKFPNHVKVFAAVKKGYKSVIGATVVARVEGPTADIVETTLRDNGAGADVIKNDGIYSGFFTQFKTDGRYAVTAEVVNDGKAKLKLDVRFSRSRGIPTVKGPFTEDPKTEFPLSDLEICEKQDSSGEDDVNTGDPAEKFQRNADAGSFRASDWSANPGDSTPPGNIRDLAVLYSQEDYDTRTTEVTLQWTAVGDDLDFGNVKSNELWVSTDIDSFLKDPTSGFKVPEKNVTKGSLLPSPPGQSQNVTILVSFSDDTETLYFVMRAKDEVGHQSLMYNIAPVYIKAKKKASERSSRHHNMRIVKALLIFEDK